MKNKSKASKDVEFSFDKLTESLAEAIAYSRRKDFPIIITKVNPDQFLEVMRVDRDFIKWF